MVIHIRTAALALIILHCNTLLSDTIGLIGGNDSVYAARVSLDGTVSNLPVGPGALPTYGGINAVAINNSGYGLIGGWDSGSGSAYGARVSPSGKVTNLLVDERALPTKGSIHAVAINDSGHGLIIGQMDILSTYGARVSPDGTVTNLPVRAEALPTYGEISMPLRSIM